MTLIDIITIAIIVLSIIIFIGSAIICKVIIARDRTMKTKLIVIMALIFLVTVGLLTSCGLMLGGSVT